MINGQANKTSFFSILVVLMVIAEYEKKHGGGKKICDIVRARYRYLASIEE